MLTWRERLKKLEHLLTWPAWGGLAAAALFFFWNPTFTSGVIAILSLLAILVVLLFSTGVLTWRFRHVLGTWPGVLGLWATLAVSNMLPQGGADRLASVRQFVLLTSLLALWSILAWRLIRRDAGLVLLLSATAVLVWSAAIANVRAGGPANLLLMLIQEADTGRVWWLNSLLLGMWCICPLAPLTFIGWFLRRLYLEFVGNGAI